MRFMCAEQSVSNLRQNADQHPPSQNAFLSSPSVPPIQTDPFRPDGEAEMSPVHPSNLLPPLPAAFLPAPVKNSEKDLLSLTCKEGAEENRPPFPSKGGGSVAGVPTGWVVGVRGLGR